MSKLPARIGDLPLVKLAYLASQVRAKREVLSAEPIAIIGMSCRFPGGGDRPEAFWEFLKTGRDAIREVPADRWNIDDVYDPTPGTPGKIYTRRGGFVEGVDLFDPHFFGIAPRDAPDMDPQQRFLLEDCWRALERAGVAPAGLVGSKTGVFLGMMHSDYTVVGLMSKVELHSSALNYLSMAAGRLAYILGLQGPTLTVDTACSSSLVSLHLACQSLRNEECDLALAGGVSLIFSPMPMMYLCENRMLSLDGRCKTFDASADGFSRGEGCGVVVLKRLSDALAQGDQVLAVIRGSAINHDGKSSGLLVPNGRAQERVMRAALDSCGVDPSQVSYVEAHGTGTRVGDPIEMEALGAVYGRGVTRDRPLLVGSVKTNIGHPEAAAGMAALIKVVLSLQNEAIPAHLNFHEPNPNIRWSELGVEVSSELRPWPRGEKRRIAGITGFGYSGTNAHLLVEEAPIVARKRVEKERPVHLMVLSAKTEASLDLLLESHERALEGHDAELGDWCFTANTGRSHFEHSAAVSGATVAELRDSLTRMRAERPADARAVPRRPTKRSRPVFLFTGQGAQYPGMGKELYETQPVFRAAIERCSTAVEAALGGRLEDILFMEAATSGLDDTQYTQPALFAIEFALSELWASWGVVPAALIGHSFGEYVAACVAGVFSVEDGLRFVMERARLMKSAPGQGAMLSVVADVATVAAAIAPYDGALSIGAINGPTDVVVSGERSAIERVSGELEARGVRCKLLRSAYGFHSSLMAPVLAEFARSAAGVKFSSPRIPLISNLTGRVVGEEITRPEYWCRHLRETVYFGRGLETLLEQGHQTFLEIGPSPVLAGIGRRTHEQANDLAWLASLRPRKRDSAQMLSSLGELFLRGAEIDWVAFDAPFDRRSRCLPTQPFQRERYWMEVKSPEASASHGHRESSRGAEHPLLGRALSLAGTSDTRFSSRIGATTFPFVADHRVFGNTVLPSSFYVEMALSAALETTRYEGPLEVTGFDIDRPLVFSDAEERALQVVLVPEGEGSRVEVYAQDAGLEGQSWSRLAKGHIGRCGESAPAVDLEGDLLARTPGVASSASFYETTSRDGVDYGPSFQTLVALRIGTGEWVARLQLLDALVIGMGDYLLHPVLLEGCCQAIAAGLGLHEEGAAPWTLAGIRRLRWFRKAGRSLWVHVQRCTHGTAPTGSISADVRLVSESGELIAEVDGLTLKRIDRHAVKVPLPGFVREWLFDLVWREQKGAVLAGRASAPFAAGRWLLFSDGGAAEHLEQLIEQAGGTCVLVTPGSRYERIDPRHVRLSPGDAPDFVRLLAELAAEGAAPTQIVYLWGLDCPGVAALTTSTLEAAVTRSTSGALNLVNAVAQATWPERPALWVVTRGVVAIDPADLVDAVAQAPLWGLGRAMMLEHPELALRLVDIDAEEATSASLLRVLGAPGTENVMALRGGRLFGARLASSAARVLGHGKPLQIRADSAYLITDGLSALGLSAAEWLSGSGARHLVLTSDQGDRGLTPAGRERIAAMTVQGCEVLVVQADLAREEDVRRVFDGLVVHGFALRGVIHAAGARADTTRPVQVLAPKVQGAWNLHLHTLQLSLDFFVLTSSVDSLVGMAGQDNYTAADSFLDALAHHRRRAGLSALTVNWGGWVDAVSDAKASSPRREGGGHRAGDRGGIVPERALQILEDLLARDLVQVGVIPSGKADANARGATGYGPLFSELMEQQKGAGSASGRLTELLSEVMTSDVEVRCKLLAQYLQSRLATMLGFTSGKPAPRTELALNEMGVDSLMAVELKNRIGRELGAELSMARFIDGSNIDDIVAELHAKIPMTTYTKPDVHTVAPYLATATGEAVGMSG